MTPSPPDLLLSSGFLAFGRHLGVLAALDARGIGVDAVVGTSSGALVGALWAAGLGVDAITDLLAARRPLAWATPHAAPWRGLFRLDAMIAALEDHLPPTFADLPRPLAVGVVDAAGRHRLLTAGDLPRAVAASCAVPGVFAPVIVDGEPLRDGAIADRVGVAPWRAWRPGRTAIAHLVARTHGVDRADDTRGLTVVRTPASGARLWSRVDVAGHAAEARALALAALGTVGA